MKGWRPAGWLIAALSLLGVTPARAGDVSFTLSPMTNELSVPAGTQYTGVLLVTHEIAEGVQPSTVEPLRLRVYAMDWTLDRKGAPSFYKAGTKPASCSAWVQVNPTDLVIPAGEKREARYTITVPPGVQGTYRTVVMFETAPKPHRQGDRVIAVNGRIGATIYVQVGPQSKRAKIAAFTASPEKNLVTV